MKGTRIFCIGMLLLALIPSSLAQDSIFLDYKSIEQSAQLLKQDLAGLTAAADPNSVALVIEGSRLSGVEKLLFMFLKERYPPLAKTIPVSDTAISFEEVMNTNKTVVLIGGPSQNLIVEKLQQQQLAEKDHPSKKVFAIFEGKNNAQAKLYVISDRRGFENFARLGPERSPLRRFMSVQAVIATASILSLLLTMLWNYLGGPIRIFLGKNILGWKKKKLQVKTQARTFSIGALTVKYRELGAIFLGAVIYALAITLAITGLGIPLFDVLKLNIIGGLVFYIVREVGRIVLSYRMNLHTEYVFWFPGALFALFTGYLGNTLNTPGIVVEHKDKEITFNKYAFVKWIIVFGTFVIAVVFHVINLLSPSRSFQLFGIICSTYAAMEILPMKPFPGRDIIKWKPILWTLSFLIMFSSYVLFNFVL